MKLGVCLQVKNEAPYLAEWVAYHVALGFDRMWIYDNGSADRIDRALFPYRHCLELISWPAVPAFPQSVIDCLHRARLADIDWLALFDADEFLVPLDGDVGTLRRVLRRVESEGIKQVGIPIQGYASDGHILIPPGRVVDNYKTEVSVDNCKAIVNVAANPSPVSTHRFDTVNFRKVNELRINHYRNKSREDELIRRGKGFVDTWGWKNLNSDTALDLKRAMWNTKSSPSPQKDVVGNLSARFATPGTERELGIDPIRIVILERNQPNGRRLKQQLSQSFRDVRLWDVGSDVRNPTADACFQNEGFTAQVNRAHLQATGAEVLWILHGDIFLNSDPIRYREEIVSAYPFGVWSPLVLGRSRADQSIPKGQVFSVRFVESVAWAVSARGRELGFPLPDGSPLGWGQDLILSRKCIEGGLRNVIDGRVSVSHVHENNYVSYDRKEALRQMNAILAREFPDGKTFGSPNQPRGLRNVIAEIE